MFFYPPIPLGLGPERRIFNARKTRFPVRLENTDRLAIVPPPPFNLPRLPTSPYPPFFVYSVARKSPSTGAFNAARFFGFSANRGKRRGFLVDLDPAISSSVETRSLKLLGSKNVRNRNAYRNRIFGIRSCRRFEEEMRSVSSRGGGEMFGALYRGRIK